MIRPEWREAAAKSTDMENPKKEPSDVAGGSRTRSMLTKDEVGFEHPAKGSDSCGGCKQFRPMHTCRIVAGYIRSGDWCEKYEIKGKR